jgi:hypothetical protein
MHNMVKTFELDDKLSSGSEYSDNNDTSEHEEEDGEVFL